MLRALLSGTLASMTAALTLAACAKREGRSAPQPMNATSHWLHGDGAAFLLNADLKHTFAGYATHHVAAILWACVFEELRRRQSDKGLSATCRDALITSGAAALIDYTITPRRFTPGWELVLSKKSMAAGYLALAGGLVAAELLMADRRA